MSSSSCALNGSCRVVDTATHTNSSSSSSSSASCSNSVWTHAVIPLAVSFVGGWLTSRYICCLDRPASTSCPMRTAGCSTTASAPASTPAPAPAPAPAPLDVAAIIAKAVDEVAAKVSVHLGVTQDQLAQTVRTRLPHLSATASTESSTIAALPDSASLAAYIDHTILKAEATRADVEQLCREAAQHSFYSVCVNGSRVRFARSFLTETLHAPHVHVAAVCGFPLGASTPNVKASEARKLIEDGASEIDMVINVGALKDGALDVVYEDVRAVVDASAAANPAGSSGKVKVILESSCLTDAQIAQASIISALAGADFVKTSTGFHASGGASERAVRLMKAVVGNVLEVKASGGVRDAAAARTMIALGATRLGTSSGVSIVQGAAANAAKGY